VDIANFLSLPLDVRKKLNAQQINNTLIVLGLKESSRFLVLALAGVETAFCTSGTASTVNNFGNVSAGWSWKGKTLDGPDTSPDGKGGWKGIVQKWRAYDTLADATRDWIELMKMPSYAHAWKALQAGDMDAFDPGLFLAHYHTWPVDDFVDKAGVRQTGYLTRLKAQLAVAKQLLP
jgi:hypothetical protein